MENQLIEFTELIEQWAEDRNLHTANSVKQYDKLVEEFGELMKGINKQDMGMIKDSIGDMYVVLVTMCMQVGVPMNEILEQGDAVTLKPQHSTFGYIRELDTLANSIGKMFLKHTFIHDVQKLNNQLAETCGEYEIAFVDCVGLAYNEIKDRKGEMRGNTFIKEADL